jgi:hypothetical protein
MSSICQLVIHELSQATDKSPSVLIQPCQDSNKTVSCVAAEGLSHCES